MLTDTLHNPPDVDEAHLAFGANCGPAALAAVLGIPVMDTRRLLADFERRRFVNPTQMAAALALAGRTWTKRTGTILPAHGLAFVQIEGPWESPGVPVTVAYRFTHWIGVRVGPETLVYDINAREWCPLAWWEANVMQQIIAATKRATGWRVRCSFEVQP